VVKPLHGNGGKAIFRVPAEGDNLGALFEVFNTTWPEPHMMQPFLPDVAKGDKRIVLIDGEVAGAINRRPGEGEFRSNLAVGGSAEATVASTVFSTSARSAAYCSATCGNDARRLLAASSWMKLRALPSLAAPATSTTNATRSARSTWGLPISEATRSSVTAAPARASISPQGASWPASCACSKAARA
jgi:hypothetical protein